MGLILGVLLHWLLGFITRDIGSLPGPDFSKVQQKHVDPDLVRRQQSLKEGLNTIREEIADRQRNQEILKDSTDNLQNTIDQLLAIQEQSIEKDVGFSPENRQMLADSQALFLENQKNYQALNKEIAALTSQQRTQEKDLASLSKEIQAGQRIARAEYEVLRARHRWRTAALKLAVLIPIFLIAAWFFIKKRSGAYWPIVYAAFITVFIRISLVAHLYFPRKYFNYIALLVLIGIVLKLLVSVLKRIISPKKNWLLKQYQEAYDKCVCPICGKPIRTGPLRYAVGGKRARLPLAGQGTDITKQEPYVCPACGSQLYGKCDKCSNIRHALLPFCEHCGNETPNWA